MGAQLPEIGREEFAARVRAASVVDLEAAAVERLFVHYRELRRWNRTVSLVGPGTTDRVVERHYGEALASLPLIGSSAGSLLDIGSGAGFPGFVIAVARPDLEVTLLESRERKWAFLQRVCSRAELLCRCVNARVGGSGAVPGMGDFDYVTVRAVALDQRLLGAIRNLLAAKGRLLLWAGREAPSLPRWLETVARREIEGGGRHLLALAVRDADE